jgi:outer membrane receptor protein involved in Fe transport
MNRYLLSLSLCAFLTVAPAVIAAPSSDTLLLSQRLSEITVSGILSPRLQLPRRVITAHEIGMQSPVSPGDALHQLPGVVMTRDGSWATSVNIRGFHESKLLFLSDGDRIQTASDIAGALSTIDLSSVERIEVVKGAGSVLLGTGALGGVVNFVMKRPDYSDNRTVSGRAGTGLQSVNTLWHSHAAVSLSEESWYLQLDGAYRSAANYQSPLGAVPNSQFNDANIGIRGGMRYGDQQEMLVSYQRYEAWNAGLPGGGVFPSTAQVRYLGVVRNQLSGEYIFSDLTDVLNELRFKAYTQNVGREVENIVNPTVAIFPSSMNRTSGIRGTADLYFNDYHSMTVGAEGWTRDQTTHRMRITTVNDTIFTGEQPTPSATMDNAGVFGQYRWVLDPNRWNITSGLRLDYIRTENDTAFKQVYRYKKANGIRTDLSHDASVLFYDRRSHELAYAAHVDVEFQPVRRHRMVLSLANAYRAASMEERFKYIDQQGTLSVGNPDLRPEKGVFVNLGYTLTASNVVIKADVFSNYLFDMIAEVQGNYRMADGQTVMAWVNKNVDQALYYGGEFELKWLIVRGVDLQTAVAYTYAEDRATGLKMPLLPPLNGITRLNYHLDNKLSTSLLIEWEYQTDSPVDGVDRHRFAVVGWLFDTASYSLGMADLHFTGGVRNIFNTAYSGWFSTLRGINRLEPGRNFFVKASLNW